MEWAGGRRARSRGRETGLEGDGATVRDSEGVSENGIMWLAWFSS